tara:strand:+ start:364 stop:609 length:246 start_codon:yes stop_codon:yes gene_type:complete
MATIKTTDTNRKSNNRNTTEYGWIVTPTIEDDFKYTPTAYKCAICEAETTPYAVTGAPLEQLIESNARDLLVLLTTMEAVN